MENNVTIRKKLWFAFAGCVLVYVVLCMFDDFGLWKSVLTVSRKWNRDYSYYTSTLNIDRDTYIQIANLLNILEYFGVMFGGIMALAFVADFCGGRAISILLSIVSIALSVFVSVCHIDWWSSEPLAVTGAVAIVVVSIMQLLFFVLHKNNDKCAKVLIWLGVIGLAISITLSFFEWTFRGMRFAGLEMYDQYGIINLLMTAGNGVDSYTRSCNVFWGLPQAMLFFILGTGVCLSGDYEKTRIAKRAQVMARRGNEGYMGTKNKLTAILLSVFVGTLGVDRFYLGYTGTGVVKLLTAGGLGIWTLIDLVRICTGSLRPADGSPWEEEVQTNAQVSHTAAPASDALDALQKLSALKEQGVLDEEEYQSKKAELLKKI